MESVKAEGFRRLLTLMCWSVELLQPFLKRRTGLFLCFLEAQFCYCAALGQDNSVEVCVAHVHQMDPSVLVV